MEKGQGRNISKLAFISSVAILLCGLTFGIGLYSGVKRNAIYDLFRSIWSDVALVYGELGDIASAVEPIHFLQPSRQPGTGVTVNDRGNDGNLVLLSGFFGGGNEIRLLRRDGSLVARWPVSFSAHFPDVSYLKAPPLTDRNVDIHGVLIQPDGSVVFNFEYSGTVKLSRCGETVWTLAHSTHHSIEFAEGGGYWVPGRRYVSGAGTEDFPPFTRMNTDQAIDDQLILRVTEDGVIAEQISVARILYDNGLEPVMTASGNSFKSNGNWDRELVHLNKIGELPSSLADAFQGFEAGDLVLSLRQYNLVLVVDPDDWRVKWHQTGPWRRQHDPEFNPNGTITVFNNNTYRLELGEGGRSNPATPRVSNIMRVDPATGRTEVVYGERAGQEFQSVIRGKLDLTPEGGLLITEFEAGRVFEVDGQGRIVWEYINRYDAEQVLEMTEARLYATSYFTVEDWSCPSATASN